METIKYDTFNSTQKLYLEQKKKQKLCRAQDANNEVKSMRKKKTKIK